MSALAVVLAEGNHAAIAADATVATSPALQKRSGGDAGLPFTRLQHYQIDPAKVFVAGISSGGFGAVQMHIAHSATFKGAAVYAGGVYWCAGTGGAATALANCGGETLTTNQASYQSTLAQSNAYLNLQSALGTIDPAVNPRYQPVYLWSGTHDTVVNPREMADLNAQYIALGATVRFDTTAFVRHPLEAHT